MSTSTATVAVPKRPALPVTLPAAGRRKIDRLRPRTDLQTAHWSLLDAMRFDDGNGKPMISTNPVNPVIG